MDQRRINILIALLCTLLFFVIFIDKIVMLNGPSTASIIYKPFTGGVSVETVYGEGVYFVWPWNTAYQFNTREQLVDDTLHIIVNNGVTVSVRVNYRYFPVKDSLPVIFRKYGTDYLKVFVKPEIMFGVREMLSGMRPEDIYSFKLDSAKEACLAKSKLALAKGNVSISNILIVDIKLPPNVVAAIERKLSEEQLSQEYDFKIDIARKEKTIKGIEASSIKMAQDTISNGLSGKYLQYLQIEALHDLSKSTNSKVIIMPSDKSNPILLNGQ